MWWWARHGVQTDGTTRDRCPAHSSIVQAILAYVHAVALHCLLGIRVAHEVLVHGPSVQRASPQRRNIVVA